MKKLNNVLLLIDGNHLAHRCRHTFSLSYQGQDVSVVYGFLRVLKSMILKFAPYSVVVCWDGGIPEHRRTILPDYKANRHADYTEEDLLALEDFRAQMDELCELALPLMGIMSIKMMGVEADDIMYQASRISAYPSIIITGDKDLIQAVNDNTSVYSPTTDKMYTPETVEKEFGVSLSNYVHWRALQGDGSDNIRGIPGIGEKTATKLFQQYHSLSGITNAALGVNPVGKLEGKVGHNIVQGLDTLTKNVQVMALYKDRSGVKLSLLCTGYSPYSKHAFRYLMSKGFVTLLDMSGRLKSLDRPVWRNDVRYPVVMTVRRSAS